MDKMIIYTSTQTHSLGLKAGLILGLHVHAIPVRPEDDYCLRGQDLREAIENGIAEGMHPFAMSETGPFFSCSSKLKPLPQLVLSEPRRVARLTISMRLAKPVSFGELSLVSGLTVLVLYPSARLSGYMVSCRCCLGRRRFFLPGA